MYILNIAEKFKKQMNRNMLWFITILKKVPMVNLTQMLMLNSSDEQKNQRKKLNIVANGIMAMFFSCAIEIDTSFD